jgi:hypothetical protein
VGLERPRAGRRVPDRLATAPGDVWYAAYGSNTDAARFARYLRGCDPAVTEEPPSQPGRIALPLRFAEETRFWGEGGVAFVDPTPGGERPTPTLVRLWRLPVAVLAQVGAQENGLGPGAASLDLAEVVETGVHRAFPGKWYDTWVGCGSMGVLPVVTLTSSVIRTPNPPGARYAGVVARGLRATHGLDEQAVADYLGARAMLDSSVLLAWQREDSGYEAPNG